MRTATRSRALVWTATASAAACPGTYLWQTREHAIAYALPFDEIWEVDVTDLPVQSSRVRDEQWYPHPIERGRVRSARPLLKLAA